MVNKIVYLTKISKIGYNLPLDLYLFKRVGKDNFQLTTQFGFDIKDIACE